MPSVGELSKAGYRLRPDLVAKGKVVKAFTFWCGRCSEYQTVSSVRHEGHARQVMADVGWRYFKGTGWTCPNCVEADAKA